MKRALVRLEDLIASFALLVMVLLPLSEIVVRKAFGRGIPGSGPIVQHLTLWVGFLGAAIAARDGKLLALATGTFIPAGRWRRAAGILAAAFGACAATLLAWGGYQMAAAEREDRHARAPREHGEERAQHRADHRGAAGNPAEERPEHAQQPLGGVTFGEEESGEREQRDRRQRR